MNSQILQKSLSLSSFHSWLCARLWCERSQARILTDPSWVSLACTRSSVLVYDAGKQNMSCGKGRCEKWWQWETEDQRRRIRGGHGEGYVIFNITFVLGGMQIRPIRSQDIPYYSQWAFAIHWVLRSLNGMLGRNQNGGLSEAKHQIFNAMYNSEANEIVDTVDDWGYSWG